MNVEHIHHYSHHLDREMNIRVYAMMVCPWWLFHVRMEIVIITKATAFWIILLILLKAALSSCMW